VDATTEAGLLWEQASSRACSSASGVSNLHRSWASLMRREISDCDLYGDFITEKG
jgi:hypothetical protein